MSKYLVFDQVAFKDKGCLVAALVALGYRPDQIEEGQALPLFGWHGDERPERAELVIRRKHVHCNSNDVGFKLTAQGYVPIISEFDLTTALRQKHGVKDFVVALRTEYSRQVVGAVARKLHGSVKQSQQGHVQKLVVRW